MIMKLLFLNLKITELKKIAVTMATLGFCTSHMTIAYTGHVHAGVNRKQKVDCIFTGKTTENDKQRGKVR